MTQARGQAIFGMRATLLCCCPPERTGPVHESVSSPKRPRIRRLSAEEIELWLHVTRGVARRTGSRLPEPPEVQKEAAKASPRDTEIKQAANPQRPPAPAEPKAPPLSPPPLAPLERRLRQKLARGRAAPEAVIDLHGMRRQEAFIALSAFLAKAQSDLASSTVEATAGGGAITVVMSGDQRVQSIALAPEVVDPEDVEMLQDLLVVAVNDALEKVQGLQQQLMGSLTGGMKIPGLL